MTFPPSLRRGCFALLLFISGEGLNAQKLPSVFRASADMVLVPVTVTDNAGKTIEGLRAKDFSVLDDQKPRPIVSFASEDAPCSVGLVLDVSGSMRNLLGPVADIVRDFFGTANPRDEFQLLTVSTQPEALSGFTTDLTDLQQTIGFSKPGGMTALLDTVYLGLSRMRSARWPRRALLILSDGMDNYSRYTQGELMRLALEADVQIYAIVLDNLSPGMSAAATPFRPRLAAKPADQARERQGPDMLDRISEKTGGLHFRVSNPAQAKEAVIKAGRALRNEYVIGYDAPDPGTSGKWHSVRVKAKVPKVTVHARNGYYAQ